MFYSVIRFMFYLPIKFLYPTKIIGKKHLIKGKSILICNHKSNMDAIILGISLPYHIRFLSKAELFKNRLLRWFFKKMGAIPVNRGTGDIGAVKEVLRALKNNQILGIFPGGTRVGEQQEENYKNGTALFSIKSGAPIIPMLLLKKPKLFSKNTLIIGEPFYLNKTSEKPSKEELQQYTKQIEEKQMQLQKKGE